MKKTTILAALVLFSIFSIKAQSTSLPGSGTQGDPYLIQSLDDLRFLRDEVNKYTTENPVTSVYQQAGKYFQLTADIDMSSLNWTPIGNGSAYYKSFRGIFDGNGNKIVNLKIGSPADSANITNAGLFGITRNAIIKNLEVKNAAIYHAKTIDNKTVNSAVLIADADTTTVDNCHVSGSVNVYNTTNGFYAGGMVGYCRDLTLINSSADVSVIAHCTVTSSAVPSVSGGLVGYVQLSKVGSKVLNCFSKGKVTSISANNAGFLFCGGIIGNLVGGPSNPFPSNVKNCYSAVTVNGNATATTTAIKSYVAGISATNGTGNSVTNCIALNDSVLLTSLSTGAKQNQRAVTSNSGTLANNYGLETMVNKTNGTAVAQTSSLAGTAGADLDTNIPAELLNTYCDGNAAPAGFVWTRWCNLTTVSEDNLKGEVSGTGTYFQGQNVTVTATAKSGYRFVRWKDGLTEVSTNASYTYVPTSDSKTLTAEFSISTSSGIESELTDKAISLEGHKLIFEKSVTAFEIYDYSGKMIAKRNFSDSYEFAKNGIYIVRFFRSDKTFVCKLIIK